MFTHELKQSKDEETVYAAGLIKYDRNGYKPRHRDLILTNKALYILSWEKKWKLKHRIPYKKISSLHVTDLSDGLIVVKFPIDSKEDKVSYLSWLIFPVSYLVFNFYLQTSI